MPIASFDHFELEMTLEQAHSASHQGKCDDDVLALPKVPEIYKQLRELDPEKLVIELRGYGAWSGLELFEHEANLLRILWIAAGNIVDEAQR